MRLFPALLLSLALVSCEKPKEDTRLTLKISPVGTQDLESYRLWINAIVLQNESGVSNQFYICLSSAADCEVDFADPESLADFETRLREVVVSTGIYSKIWISCAPDTGGYVKVKGPAELTIPIKNCGWTIPLPKPLAIVDKSDKSAVVAPEGSSITLTLFSSVSHQIYSNGSEFLAAYPNLYPYYGETTPSLELYAVAHGEQPVRADANVLVQVIKDADDIPFWASFSHLTSETVTELAAYANTVDTFAIHADGTLQIKSQGLGFDAFQRSDHTGTMDSENYHAFPL